jgi:hypothetical protein
MEGSVWLEPNAVPALTREGYSWTRAHPRDLAEMLLYPGFYRLAGRYLSYGLHQLAALLQISRAVPKLQRLVLLMPWVPPSPTAEKSPPAL